jgi:chromosome segregation ATPase
MPPKARETWDVGGAKEELRDWREKLQEAKNEQTVLQGKLEVAKQDWKKVIANIRGESYETPSEDYIESSKTEVITASQKVSDVSSDLKEVKECMTGFEEMVGCYERLVKDLEDIKERATAGANLLARLRVVQGHT